MAVDDLHDAELLAHLAWDIEELHLAARAFPAQGYTPMPERVENGEQYLPVGDWVPPKRRAQPPPIVRKPKAAPPAERPWTPRGFKIDLFPQAPPSQPLTLTPPTGCTVRSALPRWYPAAFEEAERRIAEGQKQGRCQTCMRWRWADEPCVISVFLTGKSPRAGRV